jgi:DNA-binding MarR family transcriptional regulator
MLLVMAFLTKTTKAPIKITDLASLQNRGINSISLIIDRMESKGLVKKLRDPADRRIIRITVTRKGGELLKNTAKPTTELVKRLLSALSDKEIKQAIVFTNKLIGRLELNPHSNEDKSNLASMVNFINKLSQ